MTERDPSLDMALRLLGSSDPAGGTDDDARFAKRVVAALGQKRLKSSEIDAVLAAPLGDDHRDAPLADDAPDTNDLVEEHDGAAYAAEDARDEDRGWEGAISRPPTSGPVSSLDGLKGLTRSGPHPSIRPDDIGAAKGEDSGLIDLRGMSQSGEKPIAKEVTKELADVAPRETPAMARTAPDSPAALKPAAMPSAPPATSTGAQTSSPSSAPASGAAAASAPRKAERKSRMGLWIGAGGLAAAAAAALFVASSHKSADTSSAESAPRSVDVANAKAAPTMAASAAATTTATTDPTEAVASASAAPEQNVPALTPNDDDQKIAQQTATKKSIAGTGSPPPAPNANKDVAKPTATTTPTTVASANNPPSTKGGSGSLDDVLGLNKPAVPTATVAVAPDLPDRPESGDMRVAILGKQSAINACVSGLDAPSSIVVQFSPAGTVASVSVSKGPAKGTGAEACIKSALGGAKVERSKMGGTGYAVASP